MQNKKRLLFFGPKNIVKNKPYRLQQDFNLQPLSSWTNTQVDTAPVSGKKLLEIEATIERRFTLKRARDMNEHIVK